jgi:hypothetical protein
VSGGSRLGLDGGGGGDFDESRVPFVVEQIALCETPRGFSSLTLG